MLVSQNNRMAAMLASQTNPVGVEFFRKNHIPVGRGGGGVSINSPFAASHSRGTQPPCWRAKVALGQDKQRKLPFKIMYVFCLSCPRATFALQHGGFVPHE